MKVEVGVQCNVRYTLGGVEKVEAAEIIKVHNIRKNGKQYCYVRRLEAGWLGVAFIVSALWPLHAKEKSYSNYILELPT